MAEGHNLIAKDCFFVPEEGAPAYPFYEMTSGTFKVVKDIPAGKFQVTPLSGQAQAIVKTGCTGDAKEPVLFQYCENEQEITLSQGESITLHDLSLTYLV